jgi:hypothetical protein
MLNIPDSYKEWEGKDNLKLGLPWLALGAIRWLDQHLTLFPSLACLEFGAGGSTIFFAERCRSVVSIEINTTSRWMLDVSDELIKRGVVNTNLWYASPAYQKQYMQWLALFLASSPPFQVVSIDTQSPINRDELLALALRFIAPASIIVLDNFSDSVVWPITGAIPVHERPAVLGLRDHVGFVFPGQNYIGGGTAILCHHSYLT